MSRIPNTRLTSSGRRNLCLSMLVLSSVSCAQVHPGLDETPTSSDKVPAKVQQSLHAGVARDVLVELVPESDLPAAGGGDGPVGGAAQPLVRDVNELAPAVAEAIVAEEIEQRASYYQAAQQSLIDAVDPAEVEVRTRYEHVPFMFVRVQNLHGLYALANRPEVLRIHDERFLETELAESLPLIKQPAVANSGKTGAGTAVAVIDTGTDSTAMDRRSGSPSQPGMAGIRKSSTARPTSASSTSRSAISWRRHCASMMA